MAATTTTTKSVVINAAFLQEVKEDNVHLRELLGAASKVLDPIEEVRIKPRALANLLAQIRDQLATHFALEEALGYLDDVVVTSPRFSERAFRMRAEHETLHLTIREMAADAQRLLINGGLLSVPLLVDRFREFCRRLKTHEMEENELIMDSLYDELGVGD